MVFKKILKFIEKTIGIIVGIIILLFCLRFRFSLLFFENRSEIVTNIINFISISTGFLMTTLSILATTSNSRVMKHLIKYNKIKQLNIFFIEPIIVSILLVVICIIEITFETNTEIEYFLSSIILALSINFVVNFIKIGYISINILQKIMEENLDEQKKDKIVKPNIEKAFLTK